MPAVQPARGVLLALACLVLLATMPIISNSRPAGSSALGFAVYLSIWEAVFALPLFLRGLAGADRGIFGARLPPAQRRRAVVVTLGMGAVFGLATYLYVLGIEKAGTASAAVAIQAYPLFAILWEGLFLRRRKTPLELVLTGIMVATLYFLGTGGTWRLEGLSAWFLVALSVPFLWSVAHVAIREELSRTPITPAQVTFFRVALSALFLGIALAFTDPGAFSTGLASRDQLWAAAMGLIYYAELFLWFHAIRHIDVSFASSITTPWPVLTMLLAVPFLGESVAPYQMAAAALVVATIWGLAWAGLARARRAA